MSLVLEVGTIPNDLEAKSYGFGPFVHQFRLGNKMIGYDEFFELAITELTRTDLPPNDPRIVFGEIMATFKKEPGFNVVFGADTERLSCTIDSRLAHRDASAKRISIHGYELSPHDFVVLLHYILTNTDLSPNDPRPAFIKKIVNQLTGIPTQKSM